MYIHHDYMGVMMQVYAVHASLCGFVMNVYIVDMLHMSLYVYLMSASILFAPFVYLHYSY